MSALQPKDFTNALYDCGSRRHTFDALRDGRDRFSVIQWQEALRSDLRELLWSGLPAHPEVCPKPRVVHSEEFADHTRHRIEYEAFPGLLASGYVLEPAESSLFAPGLIAIHGHGVGVEPALSDPADSDYHHGYGREAVRRGYVVFAPEILGFGRRRDESDRAMGAGQSSCRRNALHLIMLGTSLPALRIWESVNCGVDILQAWERVKVERIGVMGISMGGLMALWASALDTRICAACVSGYFCAFRDSVMSIDHCEDNYVPGLLQLGEVAEIAGLVAPRPLYIESGIQDPIFPIGGVRGEISRLRSIYEAVNSSENLDSREFDAGHEFRGEGVWEFMQTALRAKSLTAS